MENSKQDALAYEIANALDDLRSLALHQSFTRKYSEAYLRKQLCKVLSRPGIGNRGAYYTTLVQTNAE